LKLAENEQVDRSERARVSFRPIVISANRNVGQSIFGKSWFRPIVVNPDYAIQQTKNFTAKTVFATFVYKKVCEFFRFWP
jgi:hypothetical protein